MHVPVWPTLPDSTLAPSAVLEKFRVGNLAGLAAPITMPDGTVLDMGDDGSGAGGSPGGSPIDWSGPLCPSSMQQVGSSCIPIGSSDGTVSDWPSWTNVGGQAGVVVPSQSSAAWANFAATMVKAGMTLAQISAIQPGTVVSANGAILRQSAGFPVPVSSTGVGLSVNTNTTVLLAAAAIGVGLLFMAGRK